jgi:hypothetical protein
MDFSHLYGVDGSDPPKPTDELPAAEMGDADGVGATEPEPVDPFDGIGDLFEGWP